MVTSESLESWLRLLIKPIGRWRTDLLWRLFGVVLIQYVTIQAQDYDWAAFLSLPRGLHLTGLAGLLLLLSGARLICLVGVAAALISFLVPIYFYVVTLQVSEEYLIFLALPLMAILLTLVAMLSTKEQGESLMAAIDDAHCALFRVSVVVMMAFAAFHKINADFLNPQVSCAAGLFANLTSWWNVPFLAVLKQTPLAMGIITEALVPILLLVCPPIGLIYTILLMSFIGLLGATAFTLIVIVMACGFLEHDSGEKIIAGLTKWKWAIGGIIFGCGTVSYLTYSGKPHWYGFLLFQTTTIILFVMSLMPFRGGRPSLRPQSIFTKLPAVRIILIVYFTAGTINGLSPYFGWKFRSSFAMLSNLRTDQARWNHLWMPPSLFMPEHDHFIRIRKIDMNHAAYQYQQSLGKRLAKEGMVVGLVSPMSMALRLERFNVEGVQVDLHVTYAGKDYFFPDATRSVRMKQWLGELPHNKLFQEWLVADGPQPCFH